MTTADDLFDLLPRHLRTRDTGLLRGLLEAIAAEASVLETDVEDLYDDWFVETAADWALPYLADLLGIDDLPEGAGRRAVVANTVDYRRRKGTVAVAEQVVRDVTGSPTRAVEYLRLLATTAHLNHVRLDRPATADVRRVDETSSYAVAGGSLDPLMHTAEARRAPSGRGRYAIGHVWMHVVRTVVHPLLDATATPGADAWWVHPLGVPTPLFALPRPEDSVEHRAEEPDLPVPLRPRRLFGLLADARRGVLDASALPVAVTLADGGVATTLPPERLRVCGLEDLPVGAVGWYAFVDAVRGRISLSLDGAPVAPGEPDAPASVRVSHAVGGRGDVGAGAQDRSVLHERALESDPYVPRVDGVVAQRAVRLLDGDDLDAALAALPADGTVVVSIGDSGSRDGAVSAGIPAATRLVVVAASWEPRVLAPGAMTPPVPGAYGPDGLRPVLRGTVTVTGGPGSACLIDGVVIVGDLVVRTDGMTSLTLSQATVTGVVRVIAVGDDGGATGVTVRILHSMVGRLDLADTVPAVVVEASIVAPQVGGADAVATTVSAPGAQLDVLGSTIWGDVIVRTLSGTDALLDGTVVVAHRQVGCLRFSHVGPGSRVPRQFKPATAQPAYASGHPGAPAFLALDARGLETASEQGDEVGVDAHLRRPRLLAAAGRIAAAHLPVGVESYVRATR